MFNVDDLAYINAYRKSMTSNGTIESREPVIFGKDTKETPTFTLITLSDDQKFAIERAKKYALEQSIQNALKKQMDQIQTQDMNSIKQNQALVLLSRIYVGSISFEIGEEEIRKAFAPFGPIKSIALSWDSVLQKHKGFAFVEFEIPEAASLVLDQMNGFMIAGRGIKVGRPSNAPQTAALENELRQDPINKSRIYVAGVHSQLSESDIQTVFEAFGKVTSCTLDPDIKFGQPSSHKGYGWIEFETEQAAVAAVTNMNGFEIAGQLLRVGRAISPKIINASGSVSFSLTGGTLATASVAANDASTAASNQAAVAKAAASITARVNALDGICQPAANGSTPPPTTSGFSGASSNVPPPGVFIPTSVGALDSSSLSIGGVRPPLPPQPISLTTTANAQWDEDDMSVVQLPSLSTMDGPTGSPSQAPYSPSALSPIPLPPPPPTMIASEELSSVIVLENMVDVNEVDPELEEEVSEECSKYGTVLRVVVHIVPDGSAVRIFVHFDSIEGALGACQFLNNRYFGGRQVHARFYPAENFQMRNLDL